MNVIAHNINNGIGQNRNFFFNSFTAESSLPVENSGAFRIDSGVA